MTRYGWSVAFVWAASLVGAVLVGVFAGSSFLTWIPVVVAALVLATVALQLSFQSKEGFVVRMAASLAGAFVVLAAGTAVLVVLHPAAIPAVLSLH